MARGYDIAGFPLIAASVAGAAGLGASALGADLTLSLTMGAAVFGATMALRTGLLSEYERPLLAEELLGVHDRLDDLAHDAIDLRGLTTDLAEILDEALQDQKLGGDEGALEEAAMRRAALHDRLAGLEARFAELEDEGETRAVRAAESAARGAVRDAAAEAADRAAAIAAAELESRVGARGPSAGAGLDSDAIRAIRERLHAQEGFTQDLADALARANAEIERLNRARERDVNRTVETAAPRIPRPTSTASRRAPDTAPARPLDRSLGFMLQFVYDLAGGQLSHVEALTRRIGPDGRPAPTADHVEAAKAAGAIDLVDDVALIRSIAVAQQLAADGRDVAVFCNMSMQSLRKETVLRPLLRFLAANRQLSKHLVFEFSQLEIETPTDPDVAILQRIHEKGFGFSLDHLEDWSVDIGNLAKIGFRFVKLNAEALMARETASAGSIDRLMANFERVGLTLIVEKIESAERAEALAEAGARYGQGVGLAAPSLIDTDEPAFAAAETAARRAIADHAGRAAPRRPEVRIEDDAEFFNERGYALRSADVSTPAASSL